MAPITSIQLERAIEYYFGQHNQCPQPFVWTKDADLILRKVQKVAEHLVPPRKLETNF